MSDFIYFWSKYYWYEIVNQITFRKSDEFSKNYTKYVSVSLQLADASRKPHISVPATTHVESSRTYYEQNYDYFAIFAIESAINQITNNLYC